MSVSHKGKTYSRVVITTRNQDGKRYIDLKNNETVEACLARIITQDCKGMWPDLSDYYFSTGRLRSDAYHKDDDILEYSATAI